MNEGLEKITKKFGEEAFEVVIGAMKSDKAEVTNETADLMYHLFVLLHGWIMAAILLIQSAKILPILNVLAFPS